jgi:hypothetical protein
MRRFITILGTGVAAAALILGVSGPASAAPKGCIQSTGVNCTVNYGSIF